MLQIEFCFRNTKQFTSITHNHARHKNQLDFSYKMHLLLYVMRKLNDLPYFMASFKELMASSYLAKFISTSVGKPRMEI